MDEEKRYSRHLMGKKVVTKSGKVFGEVKNLTFEVRTGEILQLVLKNTTGYCEGLDLERTKQNEVLVPYSAVVALGDFVVVAEEDIL
ncbi:MAG TPA: PRC-barrel domain-containing protein [Candidatus Nanoarchaeia archaeon]|nr:PRC-barrel domain-containing protein [Candidatus Nanoarchaeia archaeon]